MAAKEPEPRVAPETSEPLPRPQSHLLEELETTECQMRRYRVWHGLISLAFVVLGLLAIASWTDWVLVTPAAARLVALALVIAVAIRILSREIIGPAHRLKRTDAAIE